MTKKKKKKKKNPKTFGYFKGLGCFRLGQFKSLEVF